MRTTVKIARREMGPAGQHDMTSSGAYSLVPRSTSRLPLSTTTYLCPSVGSSTDAYLTRRGHRRWLQSTRRWAAAAHQCDGASRCRETQTKWRWSGAAPALGHPVQPRETCHAHARRPRNWLMRRPGQHLFHDGLRWPLSPLMLCSMGCCSNSVGDSLVTSKATSCSKEHRTRAQVTRAALCTLAASRLAPSRAGYCSAQPVPSPQQRHPPDGHRSRRSPGQNGTAVRRA